MFKQAMRVAASAAVLSTSIPTVAATHRDAAFTSSADRSQGRPFLFGGATVRIGFDDQRASEPNVAFRFAGGRQTEGSTARIGDGIALGLTERNKGKLTIVGQDSKIVGEQLGLSKGATIGLVVGAAVIVGLIVLVASSDKVPDDFLEE